MSGIKPVSRQKFERFLMHVGCVFDRQKGSHRIFSKPGLTRPVVVPARGVIGRHLISSNLRTLGISSTEYLLMLKKM